ncbi:MAG: hypothetical protein O7F71_17655 [Gammaproteobacteria bacterium]|nr:hypothetical protein [Gammaproteobacteria bacterium]
MRTSLRFGLTLIVIALASGCATDDTFRTGRGTQDPYKRAILDAAVIEENEIVTLPTLSGERATVVTWTAFPDSYPVRKEVALKWGDVWVSLDQAVKERCAAYDEETLISDVQQLLGLPVEDTERNFVTMVVLKSSVFRPCANPDVTVERCNATMPDDVSSAHKAWFAVHATTSYQFPKGFPWTRLGYTYNWKHGESEVGPAEFVVRKGATVQVVSVRTTEEYCLN